MAIASSLSVWVLVPQLFSIIIHIDAGFGPVWSFSSSRSRHYSLRNTKSPSSSRLFDNPLRADATTPTSIPTETEAAEEDDLSIMSSTLTLLEHVNLNVPNHDSILDFYVGILGMGLDPRRAMNVVKGSKTVWMNCGPSQFHLPYGETAQTIPGQIGLLYESLQPLKSRVRLAVEQNQSVEERCFADYEITDNHVRLVDQYGNIFFCRVGKGLSERCGQQPIVSKADTDDYSDVAIKYGVDTTTDLTTDCLGIHYVEFNCRPGTAEKIAQFYENVFDATTTVVNDSSDPTKKIAIIGFGTIDPNGRPDQSLLFRERTDLTIPPYDGHHIALYVGQDEPDFAQAFKNVDMLELIWVNPRFSDDATTLADAVNKWQQFRFKDIIDLETAEVLMTLEHEIRCVTHSAWPGPKQ